MRGAHAYLTSTPIRLPFRDQRRSSSDPDFSEAHDLFKGKALPGGAQVVGRRGLAGLACAKQGGDRVVLTMRVRMHDFRSGKAQRTGLP